MFAGHQSDYTFASSADGLTVTVTDRSTGDVDTVTNVETLSFADGDIAVSHDGTGLVLVGQSADSIEVVGSVGVTVLGEAGDDHLMGGDGNDTIDGGFGDDTLTGGTGSDIIEGGFDHDVAVFAGHQSDYTFASSEDGLTVTVTDRSTGDFDTVTNVETLSFDDGDIAVSHDGTGLVLTGQSTDNIEVVGPVGVTVLGEAGDDHLMGGDGTDTIDGGFGDDTLTGGLGDDVLEGGDGSDVAVFAGAMSAFTFSASSDGTLTVTDTNVGTSLGVDTVSGVEALQFTDGVLTVTTLSDGRVTLTGDGGSNEVTVVGETPVTLEGGFGDDILTGGSGSDDLEGGSGSDTVYGGEGSDFIDGDDGSDALFGEGGSDDLDGGLGDDTLDGGLGSDTLDGGEGDDTLLGQDGDDTLAGGTGDDTIIGGDGADVAVFAGNKENYVFSVAADGTLTVTDTNTSQGVDTVSGVETLRFDDGDLSVATAEDGHVTLTGSDADDVIVIGGAAESQI